MDPNPIRPTRGKARGRPVMPPGQQTRTPRPIQSTAQSAQLQPVHQQPPTVQSGIAGMPRAPRQMPPRLPSTSQQVPRPIASSHRPTFSGDTEGVVQDEV